MAGTVQDNNFWQDAFWQVCYLSNMIKTSNTSIKRNFFHQNDQNNGPQKGYWLLEGPTWKAPFPTLCLFKMKPLLLGQEHHRNSR